MPNARQILLMIAALVAALLFTAVPTSAQTRTTPVTVMNTPVVRIDKEINIVQAVQRDPWYMNILGTPSFNIANVPTVKIDGTANTVAATQSGTWNVGVSSMPTVNVNTHAVTQSGAWSVGISNTPSVNIANTPSVSVSNSPTVKIDSATNTVTTASRHNTIQLWTTDQTIAAGGGLSSPSFDCSGYNEVRALLWSTLMSASVNVYVEFRSPTGSWMIAKSATWAGAGSVLPITCPVYGDTCHIYVSNGSTQSMTLVRHSYVYLVN